VQKDKNGKKNQMSLKMFCLKLFPESFISADRPIVSKAALLGWKMDKLMKKKAAKMVRKK